MARIRTFIAIDLGPEVKEHLTRLQEMLGRTTSGVKWVRPQNMHLTLLFLGEVEQLEVVSICRTVQERARRHRPFTVAVEGLGAFPNLRRPKIVWAGIKEGVDELRVLHADLEEGLLELGCYRREDRAYTPHLTLGRLSHDDRTEDWASLIAKHAGWDGGTVTADEVLVMASELRRDEAQYSVMGRVALAGH